MKFTFFDRIKLYFKEPKCIKYDIRDWKDSLTKKFYRKLKRMVYNWENKTFYSKNIYEHYGKTPYSEYFFLDKTVTFARMNSVYIVIREFDLYFENFNRLQIPSINVDTQDENVITITIHTSRPGFIIGKGGQTINYFTKKFTELFNKETKINIVEVKKDINEPVYIGY